VISVASPRKIEAAVLQFQAFDRLRHQVKVFKVAVDQFMAFRIIRHAVERREKEIAFPEVMMQAQILIHRTAPVFVVLI
jgi:hypothetical protein